MRRRIIAILMCAMLAVTFMPMMSFADTDSGSEGIAKVFSGEEVGEMDVETGTDNFMGGAPMAEATGGGSFTVNSVSKPSQISSGGISVVTMTRPDAGLYAYTCGELSLKKGIIGIHAVMASNGNTDAYARIGVSRTEDMSDLVDDFVVVSEETSADGQDSVGYIEIPSAGTYYVGVIAVYDPEREVNDWGSATQMNVNMLINWYTQAKAGTKLTAGKVYGVRSRTDGSTVKVKFSPAKKGYIKVFTESRTLTKMYSYGGTLLGTQANRKYYPVFGVNTGKTYQLKIEAPASGYYVYVNNTGVTNKSGSSKSKAATVKRGSSNARKGLIIAGSTKAQWFKFKTTKKSKVQITIKGGTNNKYKIEFYKGSSKLTKWTTSFTISLAKRTVISTSKVPKGTYYVKITPVNKSSGWYSVQWIYK